MSQKIYDKTYYNTKCTIYYKKTDFTVFFLEGCTFYHKQLQTTTSSYTVYDGDVDRIANGNTGITELLQGINVHAYKKLSMN